jgi:hypothetical protein
VRALVLFEPITAMGEGVMAAWSVHRIDAKDTSDLADFSPSVR